MPHSLRSFAMTKRFAESTLDSANQNPRFCEFCVRDSAIHKTHLNPHRTRKNASNASISSLLKFSGRKISSLLGNGGL
ncbi:hypothetical protein ACWIUD_03560 [Helicobacter sp. 23-1044]